MRNRDKNTTNPTRFVCEYSVFNNNFSLFLQAQCQRLFYESLYKEQFDRGRELNAKIELTMV